MDTTTLLNDYTVEWIENEGLLRDEGCITGGAGQGLEHKLAAIKAYYAAKLAGTHAGLEALSREEAAIAAACEKANVAYASARERCDTLEGTRPQRTATGWIRPAAMLALTTAVVITNYFVVASLTAAHRATWWLPAGIMGVGMFVLFGEKTVWAADSANEPRTPNIRMRWLTELAPPASAALLVGCFAYRAFPVPVVLGGCLFAFVLFLFCGKLLLTVKAQLSAYHQTHRQYVFAAREHAHALAAAEAVLATAAAVCLKQDDLLLAIEPRRTVLRTTELALQAEAQTKCEVFLSEHALASALQSSPPSAPASFPTPSLNGHAVHHG